MSSLLITNKTLEVQSLDARQIYQVNNITKVGRYPYQKKSSIEAPVFTKLLWFGITIFIVAIVFGEEVSEEVREWMGFAGISITVGSSVVLVVHFFEKILHPKKYLFVVATGSSMNAIFSSKSKDEVDELVDRVIEIMADPNRPVEYQKIIYENMIVGDQINQGDIYGVGVIK